MTGVKAASAIFCHRQQVLLLLSQAPGTVLRSSTTTGKTQIAFPLMLHKKVLLQIYSSSSVWASHCWLLVICRLRRHQQEEEQLAPAEDEEEEEEEEDSEYETDSEEEGFGRALLKPVFVPKVRVPPIWTRSAETFTCQSM